MGNAKEKGRSEEEEFELKKRIMEMQGAAEGMIGLGEKWRKKKSGEKEKIETELGRVGRSSTAVLTVRERRPEKIVNQIRQNFALIGRRVDDCTNVSVTTGRRRNKRTHGSYLWLRAF
ncbi:hypothetical protein DAPPUDRAFT_248462 [Daphnia pulex]|uniref:Uncharacterized protein n=1 Tax=Daphnia pulex TaxID=6669 RepID=E9GUQ2_DAPPU|nr:hypothetical protein DAPPUDRAFT_248462 [Daphnia pulex]|eukprot:EFX76901.1 hypothetical protein DAPPUDRAFT_248462 [Daphnia pulex]